MKKLILLSLLCLVIQTKAFANDEKEMRASFNPKFSPDQCSVLLVECFAFDDQEKSSCIKEISDNVFCKGSDLGKLAKKRWVFLASNMANQDEQAIPQTDTRLIDKSCMDNFDNLFSAKLLQGAIDKAEAKQLSGALDACKKDNQIELNRQ
jgi:hypothetical protein